MPDVLQLQSALATAQADLNKVLDRIAALEDKTARDVAAIVAGILPPIERAQVSIDTLTVVASNAVAEVVNAVNSIRSVIERLDGASVQLKLGLASQL